MICPVPYIRDPKTPRCPECLADIFVQADEYFDTVTIGRESKKVARYKVREQLDERFPVVMSACRCRWLRETIRGAVAAGDYQVINETVSLQNAVAQS